VTSLESALGRIILAVVQNDGVVVRHHIFKMSSLRFCRAFTFTSKVAV